MSSEEERNGSESTPIDLSRLWPAEDAGRTRLWRTPLERDRDRILHARAFRRLAGKTQLLPVTEDRQVRNRLTHTLEVTAAARSLARHLGLDQDLTEAIALAHEIGQPPFGKAGERALDLLLREGAGRRAPRGSEIKQKQGFSAWSQALRTVDRLEVRYDHPGLNLTAAVRDGLLKLRSDKAAVPAEIDPTGLRPGRPAGLEAQTVRAAIVAMTPLHDLEDALSERYCELSAVLRIGAVARLVAQLKRTGGWPRGNFRERAALHRALVHGAITDILVASRQNLERGDARVGSSPAGAALIRAIRALIEQKVVARPELRRADARGARIVTDLFLAFYRDPLMLEDAVLLRFKQAAGRSFLRDLPAAEQQREIATHYHGNAGFARMIADEIAGMTDTHATELWHTLEPRRSRKW